MQKQKLQRWGVTMIAFILTLCMSASALAAYKTIPFGEQSDAVRVMQTALKKQGFYKGSVDGKFGPATRKAVYKFQNSIGIKADGKPGVRTLTALYDGGSTAVNEVIGKKATSITLKDPRSLYYGCTGDRVKTLQRALKAAGYFKGTVDGKYGELTELAVRKFQAKRGLHVDGIAGTKTINSLNKAQKKVKIGTSFVLAVGSRGSTVRTLQTLLYRLDYHPEGAPDPMGTYGEATAEMVRYWQQDTGKPVTGNVTESQYNSLVTAK